MMCFHLQNNGYHAAECGSLVWWCAGVLRAESGPEVFVSGERKPDTIPMEGRCTLVTNAFVRCTTCGRMASGRQRMQVR